MLSLWAPLCWAMWITGDRAGGLEIDGWYDFSGYLLYPMMILWAGATSGAVAFIMVWKRANGWSLLSATPSLGASGLVIGLAAFLSSPCESGDGGMPGFFCGGPSAGEVPLVASVVALIMTGTSLVVWFQWWVLYVTRRRD
ncbi:MAG: hypothetical protein F4X66_17545 [Chloroflexi bacterium]|nr:hypothetical protein [Chloroflexota bacterium]MYE39416.1 hypothetical protein [Chloroflexota bacterium]